MTKEEFVELINNNEEYTPGWWAIDEAFEELYPDVEPKHFGTVMTSRAIFLAERSILTGMLKDGGGI